MMKFFKKGNKLFISLLHGIILFFLLWYINTTSYSSSVDEGLLKKVFVAEDLLLPHQHTLPFNFVFINTSKDISLIRDPQSNGLVTITDRDKLTSFFKLLNDNSNQHKFVLCDLFFDYPSDADTVLVNQISKTKNVIFPFHLTKDSIQRACISVPSALADYETYSGVFSKFKLIYHDTIQTIPFVLHQKLDSNVTNNYLSLNSFSPRYYIRPFQLESHVYPYYNLGNLVTLLSIKNDLYTTLLKGKFIVIGNFETDIHNTSIGKMYGPLILIDSYLSLKNGRNQVTYGWILFMIISLTITSYILFFVKIEPPKVSVSFWVDFILHNILNKVFSFLGICSAIVFISEILFSIQVTISPLFLYLIYTSWAISFYKEHLKKIT